MPLFLCDMTRWRYGAAVHKPCSSTIYSLFDFFFFVSRALFCSYHHFYHRICTFNMRRCSETSKWVFGCCCIFFCVSLLNLNTNGCCCRVWTCAIAPPSHLYIIWYLLQICLWAYSYKTILHINTKHLFIRSVCYDVVCVYKYVVHRVYIQLCRGLWSSFNMHYIY